MEAQAAVPELLKPQQVADTKQEILNLKHQLTEPGLQDPGFVRKQVVALEGTLATRTPQPFSSSEIDAASKREVELRTVMVEDGMPTSAELRRNPPGSVQKLLGWEKRNKPRLSEWRYLRKRLAAGSGDNNVASLEPFRPKGGSHELAMDGAQIPGKQFSRSAVTPTPGAVMTEAEAEKLQEVDPDLRGMIGTLDGEQRVKVLELVRRLLNAEEAPKAPAGKRKLSPEHKAKMAAGRLKAAEARKAA